MQITDRFKFMFFYLDISVDQKKMKNSEKNEHTTVTPKRSEILP